MIESDWKKRMAGGDSEYNAKLAIAKDAHYAGYLIYSPITGKWYTPKMFMSCNESVSIRRGKDDGDKFKIMDPKAGLKQKQEAVKKALQDLNDFIDMTAGYFDFTVKPKSGK